MTTGLISNLPGRLPHCRPCSLCSSSHSARFARLCSGVSNPSSRHLHVLSSSSQVSSSASTATQSLARDESSNVESVDASLPDELVSLSELVKQLADETSKSEDVEVLKLKEAFGELADDLKKKIAETSAIPRSASSQAAVFTPVTIRGYSGSGVAAPRVNPFQTLKAQVESDLEGLIPSQAGVLPTSQDKQVINRDEVRQLPLFRCVTLCHSVHVSSIFVFNFLAGRGDAVKAEQEAQRSEHVQQVSPKRSEFFCNGKLMLSNASLATCE